MRWAFLTRFLFLFFCRRGKAKRFRSPVKKQEILKNKKHEGSFILAPVFFILLSFRNISLNPGSRAAGRLCIYFLFHHGAQRWFLPVFLDEDGDFPEAAETRVPADADFFPVFPLIVFFSVPASRFFFRRNFSFAVFAALALAGFFLLPRWLTTSARSLLERSRRRMRIGNPVMEKALQK